ncbi:dCTP deaminase [Merismopedia glauca CCAP 1448/3]|uniref:dCTP deaminase n=1 Tax=Merismopedia glauca CCAP 1448/3 TaxID=1296344 RepID=A0A2T1C1Q4_9CYAN|nr:dCTP deaminase [Merismopedia glauca CCAP 1448/3]
MAQAGMIAPFESSLIREYQPVADPVAAENSSLKRVISYGLSSYGYDIRLSQAEFRIFRHIPGTVVDPKNFNSDNLETTKLQTDSNGSYFILPAHSYGLGVAVERLQVPENVTVLAIGKSTYARCFRGDTKVALVDGTSPTLEEMAQRSESGEQFWGYSIGQHGRVIVTLLENPRYIGRDCLLKVTLDNEESIFCTPDHLFLTRDGRMVEAHTLRPKDSLMPLYRQLARGYEMVYQPLNGHLYPTHRLSNQQALNHKVVSVEEVPGIHDVYCLSVPEAGNFALQAGVFVHNCGIIANLTPAEAAWRGHLTLEFSNSSSADCRIYANEGVVQLIFFEGDPCAVSYEHRQGKYQDQSEMVTLPRM